MTRDGWENNTSCFIRDFSTTYSCQIYFKHENGIIRIKNLSESKLELRVCRFGMSSGDFFQKIFLEVGAKEEKYDIGDRNYCEFYWKKVA
jgi:hypothetical protein